MNTDLQHSIDYITQKVGKKSGFSVPKGYFDELENNAFVKLTETKLPKKKSFKLPNDYFSTIEDTILAKVSSEEKTLPKKKGKVISLRERIRTIIPYASVASVLLFIGVYFLNNYNKTISIDDITLADIENWYDNGYIPTNSTELAFNIESVDFTDEELVSININDAVLEEYFDTKNNAILIDELQ